MQVHLWQVAQNELESAPHTCYLLKGLLVASYLDRHQHVTDMAQLFNF